MGRMDVNGEMGRHGWDEKVWMEVMELEGRYGREREGWDEMRLEGRDGMG